MMSCTENLIFYFKLCECSPMPASEAMILFWLKDLMSVNKNKLVLGELIYCKLG